EERPAQAFVQIPTEHRPGPVREEGVPAVRVGREDHVRRRRGERPVAVLRCAEVALDAVALAHVTHRTVRAGELAVLVERGDGDELGSEGGSVAVPQVQPAAYLPWTLLHLRGPVALGDVARGLVDHRAEVTAEQLVRMQAGQALDRVREERQGRLALHRPDHTPRGVYAA